MEERPAASFERARLEAILRTAVDAIITIDERGIVQSANPATERLFGYAPSEIVGHNVSMLMPAPFREEHDHYLHQYLNTGQQKIIGIGREVAGLHRDGSTFPIHLAVSETTVDGRRLFTGIIRDLSALKSAEAEQLALGGILENSLNEIYIFDAVSLNFLRVNRGARENLGFEMDELERMTPVSIKPEFTQARFLETLQPLREGAREQLTIETVHQRKDGTRYDVEVHLQMARIQDRQVFVAIAVDTTIRKELDRERARINEELEQRVRERTAQLHEAQANLVRQEKLATLGQVSGGIAHEIRNPLNAVKTSAYYLLHATNPPPEKTAEHLARIDRQVSLIDNVITALSDVAKLPDAAHEPLSLPTCLGEVAHSISCPANVEIDLRLPADLPLVLADPHQLPIAFKNLIRNARDAMPNGGVIAITADARDGHVHVRIRDEGVGIPAEDLPHIMEPLFSTKARGMGLGLAITKAIVEKNLGTIQAESQLGMGSTFIVRLSQSSPP